MPDRTEVARAPLPRRAAPAGAIGESLRTIGGAVLIAMLLRSFGYEPFNIPSESMMPRLLVGDYLFVAKWPYGYSRHSLPWSPPLPAGRLGDRLPERGDVVVFKSPADDRIDFIKRVIGLPGDRVRMTGGRVELNGALLPKVRVADLLVPESPNSSCPAPEGGACRYARYRETLPGGRGYEVLDQVDGSVGDDTAVVRVPAGHYFMMGDNRDNSADSRFPVVRQGIGLVPAENLVGRASVSFFSTDGSAHVLKPWTWVTAMRGRRIGERFE